MQKLRKNTTTNSQNRLDASHRLPLGTTGGQMSRIKTGDDQYVNILTLVKNEHRFIFIYDDANRNETLRQIGRFASDPQLQFSWYDAALLSKKMKQQN